MLDRLKLKLECIAKQRDAFCASPRRKISVLSRPNFFQINFGECAETNYGSHPACLILNLNCPKCASRMPLAYADLKLSDHCVKIWRGAIAFRWTSNPHRTYSEPPVRRVNREITFYGRENSSLRSALLPEGIWQADKGNAPGVGV